MHLRPARILHRFPRPLSAPPPSSGSAWAQSADAYPGARPVTLVVAWAPGGSTDFVARVVAQQLSKELNGNVVVDNRPGASGTVGHSSVARARPDGHTLLLGVNSTYAMARHLFPQRGYDDEKAFASTGRLAISPIFLCANPKLGANDIKTLVAQGQGAAGQALLRLLGRRLLRAPRHRAVPPLRRDRRAERHLPRRRPGGAGPHHRRGGDGLRGRADRAAAHGRQEDHPPRRLHAGAQPAGAGGADHRRVRLPRLRGDQRLRPARPRRHPGADPRASWPPPPPRP